MNGDANFVSHIMFLTIIYLVTFVTFFDNNFNIVDKVFIYTIIVINVIILYGITHKNLALINIVHWGYPLCIFIAPFLITTHAGKVVYTTLVLSQLYLLLYLRRCVVTNIWFKKKYKCPPDRRILPRIIPDVVYVLAEIFLIIYIWSKK